MAELCFLFLYFLCFFVAKLLVLFVALLTDWLIGDGRRLSIVYVDRV